jgi:hypothetical protein
MTDDVAHACCASAENRAFGRAPLSDQAHPSVEIRPGVLFPDWSTITSDAAARALAAICEVAGMRTKMAGLSRAEDSVWRATLDLYLRLGRAPTSAELAKAASLPVDGVEVWLKSLHARDVLVLDSAGAVVAAYPFTEKPTTHTVHLSGRKMTALCAIDALGVGAMYQVDAHIGSSCRHCETPIRVTMRGEGNVIAEVAPFSTIVWSGLDYAQGCAANSLCTVLAFFCSDEHLRAWQADDSRRANGFRLSIAEGVEVGKATFVPRLQPPARHAA